MPGEHLAGNVDPLYNHSHLHARVVAKPRHSYAEYAPIPGAYRTSARSLMPEQNAYLHFQPAPALIEYYPSIAERRPAAKFVHSGVPLPSLAAFAAAQSR